jgi:hypothetical protein
VARIGADFGATFKAAHDLKDQGSSCKKAVEKATEAVETAKKAVPELSLPEKASKLLGPVEKDVLKVWERAEKYPEVASKV